jgi:hypothetical protein
MEIQENKNLENLKRLADGYLNKLKPTNDNTGLYSAEIKLLNYGELGCVITNMLKLCIVALDSESQQISRTIKNPSINVALILEVALQLFPVDEFDLLSEINDLLISDFKNVKE